MKIKIISDNSIYEGKDEAELVKLMKTSRFQGDDLSVDEYMKKVRQWSGDEKIPINSPVNFIKYLKTAGYLEFI